MRILRARRFECGEARRAVGRERAELTVDDHRARRQTRQRRRDRRIFPRPIEPLARQQLDARAALLAGRDARFMR